MNNPTKRNRNAVARCATCGREITRTSNAKRFCAACARASKAAADREGQQRFVLRSRARLFHGLRLVAVEHLEARDESQSPLDALIAREEEGDVFE